MEEWERKLIRENLPELIYLTDCHTGLISRLEKNEILAKDDVEKLGLAWKTPGEKAKELYDITITRKNGFEHLVNALEQTKQSGVLDILSLGTHVKTGKPLDVIRAISYDENAVLGRGSFGIVVNGKFGDRPVAVKLVHSNLFMGNQQILNEVKFLQACDAHENVVRYFGTKVTGNIILIVLELCDMSLREWVADKNGNQVMKPTEVLKQVTTGFAWLHSQNIVHRDLKPENILLIINLNRVKIADFGLSRRVLDGNSFVATNNAGGTLGWMAPEILACIADGNHQCKFTYASDVFSLGCVYYYVLSDGNYAFGDSVRCQGNILDGKSMMLSEHVNHGCSQNILFINMMISKEPKSRPSCYSLLDLPLFWSQNERLTFLQNIIVEITDDLSKQSQDLCNFDHGAEIRVLRKMGFDNKHNGCVVAIAYDQYIRKSGRNKMCKHETIEEKELRLKRPKVARKDV